jgi:membrane protein YdbS with pleckstrin-like domain
VDDLFAPPGTVWQRVSPALARMRRTVLGVVTLAVLVAVVVLGLVLDVAGWLVALALVVVLLAGAWGWFLVGRNARRWGYAERDEDLYITRGALVRRLVVVPYGRMQYVDVQAGPLDRAYGIARVQLHTASPGTSAHIPGLPADEAARLRDRLTSLGEAQAAGL